MLFLIQDFLTCKLNFGFVLKTLPPDTGYQYIYTLVRVSVFLSLIFFLAKMRSFPSVEWIFVLNVSLFLRYGGIWITSAERKEARF